jgi:macrolide-specific efflux system membrane fusion protein
MQVSLVMLGSVLVLAGAPSGSSASVVSVPHCLVSLIEEAQVPAEEPGVLDEVNVREGQQVQKDAVLAKIDDDLVQMQNKISELELKVADEQAANDVNVRYAKAAAEVARAAYDQRVEANQRVPGAVPKGELREYYLKWQSLILQIEQSELDLRVAGLQAQVSEAQVEAAREQIERRQILSPWDGVVVDIKRNAGEWVNPGDEVLYLVRMDRLRIEGFLSADEYMPAQIQDRPVTIEVKLAGNRVAKFQGKVTFVDPLVDAGRDFKVFAEVANRQENGFWVARPGLTATMHIHLK